MAIKILETRKVGHNKDMLQRAMNTRMNVDKQEDGTFKAEIVGQDVSASGKTFEDAVRAAKDIFRKKFEKGEQEPQRTV
jgi:hypothetical protein